MSIINRLLKIVSHSEALTEEPRKTELDQQYPPPRKVNLGSNNLCKKEGWVTIDSGPNCDIKWDLRNGIPFSDNSIHMLYSSHLLEHLTFKEMQVFLKECLRVLEPGGYFLVCVPDASIYVKAYLGIPEAVEYVEKNRFFGYTSAFNGTTKIDILNYTAYMDGHHKYMFDQENLLHVLTVSGFRNVCEREFNPMLDRQERDYESIYAVGYK